MPEVQILVDRLKTFALGKIISVWIIRQNGRYLPEGQQTHLVGRTVLDIRRRGKFIVFDLDRGKLVCHNAMSGFWDSKREPWTFDYVEGKREASDRDVRVEIKFLSGEVARFHDSRLFGSLLLHCSSFVDADVPPLALLGPDALDPEWKLTDLVESCRRHPEWSIKRLLMDQHEVAGIGNIYSVEALFHSGVHPNRSCSDTSDQEIRIIHSVVQSVLRLALELRLDYDKYLAVYGRKDRSCLLECGQKISSVKIDNRTSYFCPGCQR